MRTVQFIGTVKTEIERAVPDIVVHRHYPGQLKIETSTGEIFMAVPNFARGIIDLVPHKDSDIYDRIVNAINHATRRYKTAELSITRKNRQWKLK